MNTEDQRIPYAVVIVLFYGQYQKTKKKFESWVLGCTDGPREPHVIRGLQVRDPYVKHNLDIWSWKCQSVT